MIYKDIDTLDNLLTEYAPVLGKDFVAYRHHTYRVVNFCAALCRNSIGHTDAEFLEKIAVAAAFHDLGIWVNRTFDYLPPSNALVKTFLSRQGKAGWEAEISSMILYHHKITRCTAASGLAEPFRKADLIDLSLGRVKFGLPSELVQEILAAFPTAGFHLRLLQLALVRLLTHPFNPLPMLRW